MSRQAPVTILASAARTATGNSPGFKVPKGGEDTPATQLAVFVDVTTVTGTSPTMTPSVEWSHDGTTWFTTDPAETFTAITAAGKKVKVFTQKGPFARLAFTIGGTSPSFTFSATAFPI